MSTPIDPSTGTPVPTLEYDLDEIDAQVRQAKVRAAARARALPHHLRYLADLVEDDWNDTERAWGADLDGALDRFEGILRNRHIVHEVDAYQASALSALAWLERVVAKQEAVALHRRLADALEATR